MVRELPGGATVWYTGHWGSQRHALKAGMQEHDSSQSTVAMTADVPNVTKPPGFTFGRQTHATTCPRR